MAHKIEPTSEKSLTESSLDGLIQEELKRSFEEGVKKGEIAGYEKAQREMEITVNLFKKITKNLLDKISSLKTDLSTECTDFCLKVCEKLLLRELDNPATLRKVIFKTISLRLEKLSQTVVVYLSATDLDNLKEYFKKYNLQEPSDIRWEIDPCLRQGSFRIDLSDSVIFYDIPTEIDNLSGYLAT